MTLEIVRRPEAEADLFEIWLFIADDNPDAATRMLTKIDRTLLKLARNPRIGRTRPELSSDLRSLPVPPYVIFYCVLDRQIDVIRVLHGARDIDRLFEQT